MSPCSSIMLNLNKANSSEQSIATPTSLYKNKKSTGHVSLTQQHTKYSLKLVSNYTTSFKPSQSL